jgi:hypothetical protein
MQYKCEPLYRAVSNVNEGTSKYGYDVRGHDVRATKQHFSLKYE